MGLRSRHSLFFQGFLFSPSTVLSHLACCDPCPPALLPGEAHGCDRGVLLLHADALRHKIARLEKSPIKYVCNTKPSSLRETFAKVVVLVRNPYDTLWEAYMRELWRRHDVTQAGRPRPGPASVNAQHGLVRKALFEQVGGGDKVQRFAPPSFGSSQAGAIIPVLGDFITLSTSPTLPHAPTRIHARTSCG